jgi:signal transduction histidine kinase
MDEGVSRLGQERVRRLIDAGQLFVAQREVGRVLERLLVVARDVTGARYAAVGVSDETDERLADFITAGIGERERVASGERPSGRGVLWMSIADPAPLRIADVGAQPWCGFPAGHPMMRTVLAVPILIGGEAWGNLYLTDKEDGCAFDDADEEWAVLLASWAAIAIENARLYREMHERQLELQRSVHALEASAEIAIVLGGETGLERVLELIAKRARALVEASAVAILLVDGGEFAVAAVAGEIPPRVVGFRLPKMASIAGRVLASGRSERITDVASQLHFSLRDAGVRERAGMFVPLRFRGTDVGVIEAFDRVHGPEFRIEDERVLLAAAATAATAVATAKSVEREQLNRALQAAEQERQRSARELHDQTLQTLGALRVELARAERKGDLAYWQQTGREAMADIQQEIANLRAIITDLRPPLLDDIGLAAALEALIGRARATNEVNITAQLNLTTPDDDSSDRLGPELEAAVYRVVQEALNNAITHANAQHITVEVSDQAGHLDVLVRDDGHGFDPDAIASGFGLMGMRERVSLVDGQLNIASGPGGTAIEGRFSTARALQRAG